MLTPHRLPVACEGTDIVGERIDRLAGIGEIADKKAGEIELDMPVVVWERGAG
jgi:hypothetical protein